MPKKVEVPNGALRLVQTGEGCHAFAEGEDGKKKLKMNVYSGGVIKDHFWWGDLAIDLEGIKFGMSKYPVLENHDTDRRIAFTGKPIVDENGISLDPNKTKFLENEESVRFQKESSVGFPFQASMYAKPSAVERISDGEKAKVNGFSMKGPATIWRKCEFKEASVCVFGWDSKTLSSAFSKDEKTELEFEEIGGDVETLSYTTDSITLTKEKEVKEMPKTVEELQEKYSDLTGKLTQQITDDLTTKFDQEKEGLNEKITQLSTENEEKEERLDQLEKKDIIRSEKELKSEADHIVSVKLAATDISERLYDKIRRLINHNKFVKDDRLDTKAFAERVDDEIKDFEEIGATNTVLGFGASSREEEDPAKLAEKKLDDEDDAAVEQMLKHTGDFKEE